MTPEELLQPRYRVIADYPKSFYKTGEIIKVCKINGDLIYCDDNGTRYSDYPHLFERLEWWEERSKAEMPFYIKSQDEGNVIPIDWGIVKRVGNLYFDESLPATEEEYINYKNSIK